MAKVSNLPLVQQCQMKKLPYSGKLLREKTFTNWWKIQFSQRKLSWIAHFCCAKRMPCLKISQRKLSQIATKLWNSRKFSPSKVSCYTVHQSCMDGNIPQCHFEPPVLHTDICACAAPENLLEWSGAHWEDTVSKGGDPVARIIHQLFSNQSSNVTISLSILIRYNFNFNICLLALMQSYTASSSVSFDKIMIRL